ncbi:DUF262 domain-containing protein [Thiorhodovibrio frisius]|uniref:GmrSD restriction endonucleases N-terminal domain-containing protein n=1 Tax=Thiorhodovibrio frisius TaxID=631362 RepID=H8Z651_9GAMM|nr:DUF262 domain-containing protein [Thiorhodovibrio frisius]EIC19618.1 Protein of unknown function DUF262 [Thiorhodovibrio frisius]WPL20417.1 hypothetical protein Thiofri_00507 [Thiorhodovibrio frisius]
MSIFDNGHEVETLTIKELIEHRLGKVKPRLWLPPIQRSMVWTNAQIINYWDSLLRGYPPGLMMVHRVDGSAGEAAKHGADAEGKIQAGEVSANDLQLFDGQQRMATILLGLGLGQLQGTHKLWVDLGQEPKQHADTRFQLRISTIGQPFGYARDYPNNKFRLDERREAWKNVAGDNYADKLAADNLFLNDDRKAPLIEGVCPVLLKKIWELHKADSNTALAEKLAILPGADKGRAEEFAKAFETAVKSSVILQLVGPDVVGNESSYVRFFSRLGQGGTRLSDDELSYSMIKARYPEIREKMNGIMVNRVAGRLASEVELVLAILRVAKLLKPWKDASDWEKTGRPNPNLVSKLDKNTEEEFKRLLGLASDDFGLLMILKKLRTGLIYSKENSKGFPAMLIARLPHQLLDLLILFAALNAEGDWPGNGDARDHLIAFCLYWLLYVGYPDKAADLVYRKFLEKEDQTLDRRFFSGLIHDFEDAGICSVVATLPEFERIREKANEPPDGMLLRPWAERFGGAAVMDKDHERKPGEALRNISTNRKLISHALMWLQRDYLSRKYPMFDPTSGRDEDLPVDLDHLIPQKRFRFHWTSWQSYINEEVKDSNYWNHRDTIGHSLGNFRWLDASENRSRHYDEIEDGAKDDFLIEDIDAWNTLIRKQNTEKRWDKADIQYLQTLIDMRTLFLCEKILDEGGIWAISEGDVKALSE